MTPEEEYTLRNWLWLKHDPKHTLYGDDGEMQCNTCMLDFKRDSVEKIHSVFTKQATDAAIKFFEDNPNWPD